MNATIDAAKAVESYLGMNGSGLIKTVSPNLIYLKVEN